MSVSLRHRTTGHVLSAEEVGARGPYLAGKGYRPVAEFVDLETATVKQLKAYATQHSIDLSGMTKKADMVAAISASPLEPIDDPNAEQDTGDGDESAD